MIPAVKCPECGKEVEITTALRKELEEHALVHERQKHKKELEEATAQVQEKERLRLKEQFEQELKDRDEEIKEEKKRIADLIAQVTEANKIARDLRRRDEERQLELDKKIAEMEEAARKRAADEQHFKMAEKDKKISDLAREMEELKRKLEQGSQQAQGEVMELEIEEVLRKEFASDEISPVSKGQRGADVIQVVVDRQGNKCGTILWETKNAKWNEGWIQKLKEDQRQVGASTAVLVSENLPPSIKSAGVSSQVWVTNRACMVAVGTAIRGSLIKIDGMRKAFQGKSEDLERVYDYLTSVDFQHRVEAMMESYNFLLADLEKERRYFALKWAKQEKQVRSLIDNTFRMHGELKGIMGSKMGEIKLIGDETSE